MEGTSNVDRQAILREEQAAVDRAYRCIGEARQANGSRAKPTWSQDEPESGTSFIPDLPPELRDAHPGLGARPLVFMRVDVHDSDEPEPETFHVGRRTVKDPSSGQRLVVNWTAPAAVRWKLALPSRPGDVLLRRHLRCEDRKVINFTDDIAPAEPSPETAERTADTAEKPSSMIHDFLLEDLERAREGHMRDIVETIQHDQLKLVSETRTGVHIIQGGPGTGKTAVGLHRVTWLLDPENSPLGPEDILVVGPNEEFLRYIGEVLPQMGNRDVTVLSIDKLWGDEKAAPDLQEVRKIKADARMAEVLRMAVQNSVRLNAFERNTPPTLTMMFEGVTIQISSEQLADIVRTSVDSAGPFDGRRRKAIDRLVDLVLGQYRQMRPFDNLDDDVRRDIERRPPFSSAIQSLWPALTPSNTLRQLFADRKKLAKAAAGILGTQEQERLLRPQRDPFTAEDLVLLDELRFLLSRETPRTYRHVVIDESQDLTPMQARGLTRRCPSGSMTVLGDLAQATGPYAYDNWTTLGRILCDKDGWSLHELTVGYRVPSEVMAFAQPLAQAIAPGATFPRSVRPADGSVETISAKPWELLDLAIKQAVGRTGTDGRSTRSIAIIVPDDAEWIDEVRRELASAQKSASEHAKGIRILPATLAKGLEFDHVIVLEPASIAELGPTGRQQLYVAITRCTQTLTIVHTKPLPIELAPSSMRLDSPSPAGTGMQCTRFHRDGTKCTNTTTELDAWCRQPECDGFRRSQPSDHQPRFRRLTTPQHADFSTRLELSDEDVRSVNVTRAAKDQFIAEHGGSEVEAEAEIRSMLPALLEAGRHIRQHNGYWLLDHLSFRLVLAPNGEAITAYLTVHIGRTYDQVSAGVKSRVSLRDQPLVRSALGQPPGTGPQLSASAVERLDAAALYIPAVFSSAFDHLRPELHDLPEREFEERLRAHLATELSTRPIAALPQHFRVLGEAVTWAISGDGRTVEFVRRRNPEDLQILQLIAQSGGCLPDYLSDPDIIGRQFDGIVGARAGTGQLLVDIQGIPTERTVLHLRPDESPLVEGEPISVWVDRQTPTGLVLRTGEFGRLPISDTMRPRYLAAVSILMQPANSLSNSSADDLTELIGMAQRCTRHDQADWLSVWECFGRPDTSALTGLAALAGRAIAAITAYSEEALQDIVSTFHTSEWPERLRKAQYALSKVDDSADDSALSDSLLAFLIERAQQARTDKTHELVRNELMVHLFRSGANPADSDYVDIMRTADSETVLYEVIGAESVDYAAVREGAIHLMEVKEALAVDQCVLFVVAPDEPTETWIAERLTSQFNVSLIWRTKAGWAGSNIDLALGAK